MLAVNGLDYYFTLQRELLKEFCLNSCFKCFNLMTDCCNICVKRCLNYFAVPEVLKYCTSPASFCREVAAVLSLFGIDVLCSSMTLRCAERSWKDTSVSHPLYSTILHE